MFQRLLPMKCCHYLKSVIFPKEIYFLDADFPHKMTLFWTFHFSQSFWSKSRSNFMPVLWALFRVSFVLFFTLLVTKFGTLFGCWFNSYKPWSSKILSMPLLILLWFRSYCPFLLEYSLSPLFLSSIWLFLEVCRLLMTHSL